MRLRWRIVLVLSATITILVVYNRPFSNNARFSRRPSPTAETFEAAPLFQIEGNPIGTNGRVNWTKVPQRYPVKSFRTLPSPRPNRIPRIQAKFGIETSEQKNERLVRLEAVKSNFTHAWNGYKKHAWMKDEVAPLSGGARNSFGGWAATLVDALDALWIMGLKEEFEHAVAAIANIDFSTSAVEEINVFETTIRYLGGFLAAYDLTEGKYPILLKKAEELTTMLYKAFDTPNRMPLTRWKWKIAAMGINQEASPDMLIAEIGSLSLEFTRYTQLTGDNRFFDAVQRIMDLFDAQQDNGKIPGLWPIVVDAKNGVFNEHGSFTIGGMADSAYEYLPKQHLLLGGASDQYRNMYEKALEAMKRNVFYRPMNQQDKDVLFPGSVSTDGTIPLEQLKPIAEAQHLGCFAGGLVALAARLFSNEAEMVTARKLMEGCLWIYEAAPQGIMPEIIQTIACDDQKSCPWNEQAWLDAMKDFHGIKNNDKMAADLKQRALGLPPGVIKAADKRYILRPEAIESVFILYRITGDRTLQDRAWNMFNNIIKHTKTDIAHAALDDCTIPTPIKADKMESFWLSETLKYFYLIFSEPDVVSLDEYVLNTEAHPLKRPR